MSQKQTISNTLRIHRKKAGLRQVDVARSLGFGSTDRICRWEKGRALPHLPNLFKLCALYKALPHELYGELLKNIEDQVRNPSQEPSLSGIPYRPE